MLDLVETCILKATGNASSDDPEDEEKEKKWEAVKAQIGAARADGSGGECAQVEVLTLPPCLPVLLIPTPSFSGAPPPEINYL